MNKSKRQTKRIVGLFPELLGVGGIQEAGRLTAAALDAIASRHDHWATSFLSINDGPAEHDFEVARQRVSLRGFDRSKIRFVASALGESKRGVQVVLAAHPYLALPAAWMKWRSPRIKTMVMSHGVEVWKPLSALRHRALLSADFVLAPSTDTAQKLLEIQDVPVAKIRKLAWPLNPDFLRMADDPAGLPSPQDFPNGRVILTVGRWAASERYKGVDDLIRAITQLRAKFPGLILAAVGDGDDLSRLQKIADDSGVSGSVRFFTNLSRRQIAACYARSEIFALPSTGEGFGLVFLEAMAFGKPLIAVACGGSTDIVQDHANGLLVPPHDLNALIGALSRLLEDSELRMELGRRGTEIVRQQYSFEVFQSRLERILEECGMDSAVAG
ncbi:MAG: glycosyltransferase family 4 protein [Candidatus Acidiferrales bacterium]